MRGVLSFLPSDAAVGVWSLILLIVIRFVGGVFMGGEYTSNNTLALEMVPACVFSGMYSTYCGCVAA